MAKHLTMSARSILILSLGLNLALATWLVTSLRRAPVSSRATKTEGGATVANALPAWRPVPTNLVEVATNRVDAPRFRWSQLETNDFEAYVANLRAIDCPDHTVRHLIIGEVEALYGEREANAQRPKAFWETATQRRAGEASALREQAALEEEERATLRQLVGVDWSGKAEREWVTDDFGCLIIGFLTDEQALRLADAFMGLEKRTSAFRAETDGIVIDADEPRLEALLAEAKRALESGLTPAEVQEATLRGLSFAKLSMERDALAGVPLTGDELRRLTAISSGGKDLITAGLRQELDSNRHGANKTMEELLKEVSPEAEREIHGMLGEPRSAAYERSKDEAFREFAGTARRLNLSLNSTVNAWEVRRTAEAAARELKAAADMSSEALHAALNAMRRETEQAIKMAVGAQAVKEFFSEDGDWVSKAFGAKEGKR